jgi:hypothetical protein
MKLFSFAVALIPVVNSFVVNPQVHTVGCRGTSLAAGTSTGFEVTIDMPPSGSGLQANMKISPILSVPSEIVVVRYKLPFGLDVAPKNSLAVCTKDGAGGEKVGDVLRYTSRWAMGLPSGDGVISTVASFGGAASWQCGMFNVMNARSWEEVVEALTSNVEVRANIAFSV